MVAPQPLAGNQAPSEPLVLYVPEVEEIRVSPVVARKGYLNVLEHKSNGWKKRWVVSRISFRCGLGTDDREGQKPIPF